MNNSTAWHLLNFNVIIKKLKLLSKNFNLN